MTERIDVYSEKAASIAHVRMSEAVRVVPTGFPDIDRRIFYWGDRRGIPRGTYFIVGGASGVGKTRLAQWFMKQAVANGESAELLSMEMPEDELIVQQLQGVSDIPYNEWIPSMWTEGHGDRLIESARKARGASGASLTLSSLLGRSQLHHVMETLEEGLASGTTFFVVDNLQLVKYDKARSVVDRAEFVSEAIREWAFSNRVTVCALSQIKREASDDYTRTPVPQDLWGGTSMESNAAFVLMLDHSRKEFDPDRSSIMRTWVVWSKSRMGPDHFDVPVEVDFSTLTYRAMHPDEEYNYARRPNER